MHVLVTGGAGYIGSHACKQLAERGITPVTYDSLVYGHQAAVRWGPFVQGELHDVEKLTATLKHYQVESVVHFAAFAYVGESVQKPDVYYQNNVGGSLALLAAMRAAGVSRLVFSSTCAIYGTPQRLPLTEDHPMAPLSPYGASKMMVERILQDFAVAYGLSSICLRYFNAAGADSSVEIGENHAPETHLIPLAIAATRGEALTVFGDDYPTPDGTCIRDYIHVTDLADAHVLALQRLRDGAQGAEAYNLGTGTGFSVKQVLQTVEKVCGVPVHFKLGTRRPGDPASLVANSGAARQALAWEPKLGDLHSIVESAWRWHTKTFNWKAAAGLHGALPNLK